MNTTNVRLLGVAAASALALAGCATSGYGSDYGSGSSYGSGYSTPSSGYGSTADCYDCGVITSIQPIDTQSRAPNATGAVLGGLVGAAAGRELADDESEGRQNTATVAGAVAGAVAGNAIQNANQRKYSVQVRMDDGRTTTVTMDNVRGLQVGSAVRVANGQVIAR